jgi:hypothetical protein
LNISMREDTDRGQSVAGCEGERTPEESPAGLVSVPLGNATPQYPNGDHIQTVEPWTPPKTWEGLHHPLFSPMRQLQPMTAAAGRA